MYTTNLIAGPIFLAKKENRCLVSEPSFLRPADIFQGEFRNFSQTVPGRVGDLQAGYDPVFNGAGWQYSDAPDYVVYSSLDFDSNGVDITGSGYNDWPLRIVNGRATYIADPLSRLRYNASYRSDEDIFCVFKDTDTRADLIFSGPDGPSIPIGLEFQNTIHSWGTGPGKDIVVFQYDVFNKSGVQLDSCFFGFSSGLIFRRHPVSLYFELSSRVSVFTEEPWRNLVYHEPTNPDEWPSLWTATPIPPTIGYPLLETPVGYKGFPLGLTRGIQIDSVYSFYDSQGRYRFIWNDEATDSIVYDLFTSPAEWVNLIPDTGSYDTPPLLMSGPFPMSVGDSVRFTLAYIFADDLDQLLLMHDYIVRVYNSDFARPIPPPVPHLTATGLDRSVKLSWDKASETATDPMIPDSLGDPFRGYRLLRATREEGPFVELGRWVKDTLLVYEYLDRGEDIGGLKNNVKYYYQLHAFDEGAPRIKQESMETAPVEGVNSVSVIPTTEPSNATSEAGSGTLQSGLLGDVTTPRLIPKEETNYNALMSGRTFDVTIGASTDGVSYQIPVTVRDTISGRVHNAIVDIGLMVHGTPETAGIKEGTGVIEDVFGLGAADMELDYRFEQLPDPFHIEPTIESTSGADVPVITQDSLGVTGVGIVTPYTVGEREVIVEFLPGGEEFIFMRGTFSYLNIEVRDSAGVLLEPGVDWTMNETFVLESGTTWFPLAKERYYLSGTINNGTTWDIGHLLTIGESTVAFDFPDRGQGSGKVPPLFSWASSHREGTVDFQAGDKVHLIWSGGIKGTFPDNAKVALVGGTSGLTEVTEEMMEGIRIVPNPFLVRDQRQTGEPKIYFNYLPDECTIRIYTIALDLVTTIHHQGGSRAEWDLQTEGGQLVASQLLIAHIETPNGKQTTKKFAVVIGG